MSIPYAEVIGDPIAHSKSPLIHKFWLKKLGIEADYRACLVREGELAGYFAQRLHDPDWRGCNVTMPHKIAVLPLVDTHDEDVASVLASNCIVRTGNSLVARNTDGFGVDAAIRESVSSACIIGNGGAARAALANLEVLATYDIRLIARDISRASILLSDFGFEPQVFDFSHASFALNGVECVINATPLGMSGHDPMPAPVLVGLKRSDREAIIFDMVYDPIETDLLIRARQLNRRTADGLTMLIAQADASFWFFFGEAAPREYDADLRELLTS